MQGRIRDRGGVWEEGGCRSNGLEWGRVTVFVVWVLHSGKSCQVRLTVRNGSVRVTWHA